VEKYIEFCKANQKLVIADFGCGTGVLAQNVTNEIYSFDLVSKNEKVIACDMANTPLESGKIDLNVSIKMGLTPQSIISIIVSLSI